MSDEQATLRDTLSEAFEAVETPQATETPVTEAPTETPTEPPQETAAEREERLRDERGRFKAKEEAPPAETPPAPVQALPRPSSWKKDYEDRWQKISAEDRAFAEYLIQREQEFAKGVSTYKQQFDQVRPLMEAVQPFVPILQQHNIQPAQWIQAMGRAHHTLSMGSPEQKAQAFHKLAQDYGVPLDQLYKVTEDGRLQLNTQLQVQQPAQQPQDVRAVVAELLEQERMQQQVSSMQSDTENYPHFEEVRQTMAGLLQAEIVADLKSAYDAALRLPIHAHLLEAQQQQQREREEAQRKAQAAAAAQKARAQAVSVKSATPTGTPSTGKKGLRDILAEQVEATMGGARV